MAIYKKCSDPYVFGFGIFLPSAFYKHVSKYREKVEPLTDFFVKSRYNYKKKPIPNSMRLHITIKYLGYHKNYSNREIESLIPDLKEISKKYLPLEINVKGLDIRQNKNYYPGGGVLIKFWPTDKIRKFHEEVIKKLNVDIFRNMDGKNFDPHIVLAGYDVRKADVTKLKRIVYSSRKDKEMLLRLTEPYIFFKNRGPVKIFEKKYLNS
jgi:2'-5' RNA ligase